MQKTTPQPGTRERKESFLRGGGRTGEHFRRLDWSAHPLGPSEEWPVSLKTALGIVFHSRQPACLLWGEEHYYFYNDGYIPILGEHRHPSAMGARSAEVWEELWETLGPQFALTLREGRSFWHENQPFPLRRPGGRSESFFTYNCTPVFREDGVPGGALVTCTETTGKVITERKLMESQGQLKLAIEMSELERKRFESVFENSPALLTVLRGPSFVYEKVNPAYRRTTGRNPIGKPVREVIPAEEGAFFLDVLERVYRTGEPVALKEVPVTASFPGQPPHVCRYFDISYARVGSLDGPYSIYTYAVEITDRVLARQRIQEAVRARDEFLSVASHELRTPLSSLKLQAQLQNLQFSRGDPGALEPDTLILKNFTAQRQLDRLDRLVSDMLDVSRIASGMLSLEVEELDFAELVRLTVPTLSGAPLGTQKVEIEALTNEPLIVKGDAFRLDQVVTNLISNAVKYGLGRPVKLRVLRRESAARLEVIDQGMGITPDNHERIFGRYERAVSPQNFGGLGLGLYITRQIVQLHHGRVWVESEPGQGAIFVVEIPLAGPASRA